MVWILMSWYTKCIHKSLFVLRKLVLNSLRGVARLGRALIGTRFLGRPIILSHLITLKCNADCPFCLWKGEAQGLTTEEIKGLYCQAGELGFLGLVVWGGEPLLREDISEVLQVARLSGLRTTLITNGYYLPERFEGLGPYLDTLTISLDAVREDHDALRHLPGTFQRANEGIKLIRTKYKTVKVLINCVITRLNIQHISPLLEFSRENDLPIMFEPMTTWDYGQHPRTVEAQDLIPSSEESLQVSERLINAKSLGFPIVNSYEYLKVIGRRKAQYKCWFKRLVLRVEVDGKIVDCLQRGNVIGDTKDSSLSDILHSPAYNEFLKRTQNCSACVDSATVESSFLWGLHPSSLFNALKVYGCF